MGTQTQIDQPATFVIGDSKDSCSGVAATADVGSPTYSEIQQMLIESQNFTIQLLREEIDTLQHFPFSSFLNPQAEAFIPSTDGPQLAPVSSVLQQAQEICLSELILDQLATDANAESVVEVQPIGEPLSREVIEEMLSELQGVKAALANREQMIENIKTEFANALNPDMLASAVENQVFQKN